MWARGLNKIANITGRSEHGLRVLSVPAWNWKSVLRLIPCSDDVGVTYLLGSYFATGAYGNMVDYLLMLRSLCCGRQSSLAAGVQHGKVVLKLPCVRSDRRLTGVEREFKKETHGTEP